MPSHTNPGLPRGEYRPAGSMDLRSPCPIVNGLANHGYIARDGRNIIASDLAAAARQVGLSRHVAALLSYPIYNEIQETKPAQQKSLLGRIWAFLQSPWIVLSKFAMRNPNQIDAGGRAVLNLDQLSRHNVVEHDVSFSRRDAAQGDNTNPDAELIQELITSSSDDVVITAEDLAALRKRRIEQQKRENPKLEYGAAQHQLACGEIAMILKLFGDGKSVPCEYVAAIFKEERLPSKEGWVKRSWWTSLGLFELMIAGQRIKKLIGIDVK